MTIPDPYKVLQVDPEAEDEVIEAAYRRLARKYHPDVAPGPESQSRMVRLNQAWELLRDPRRRAAVDRARARAAATSARVAASEGREVAAQPVTAWSGGPAGRDGTARWGERAEAGPVPGATEGPAVAGVPPGNPSGPVLDFGRYAGWSLGEIARTEPEYLEWLDRMPIGRAYRNEIAQLLRQQGYAPEALVGQRGLFRRR